MNFEYADQSVQFKFNNEEKYGKNGKRRIYGHVSKEANAEGLVKVGKALSTLQGDALGETVLITKQVVRVK